MFTIQYVKDPKWCDEEQTFLECVVKYAEFDEEHPTGVKATDGYSHIQELWQRATAGEFGPIAEYVAPPPVEPVEPPGPISTTPLQFIDRFTEDEQLAIVTATMSNPVVKLWYDKLLAAQEVVFADPRLSAGLDGLVAAGLITEARKAEILPEASATGVTVL